MITERYPLNVPGKYYVGMGCTDCDLCRALAPDNLARDPRTGHSYVARQPATRDEVRAVEQGVADCPTGAVHADGDRFDWTTTPILDWNHLYRDRPEVKFDLGPQVLPRGPG